MWFSRLVMFLQASWFKAKFLREEARFWFRRLALKLFLLDLSHNPPFSQNVVDWVLANHFIECITRCWFFTDFLCMRRRSSVLRVLFYFIFWFNSFAYRQLWIRRILFCYFWIFTLFESSWEYITLSLVDFGAYLHLEFVFAFNFRIFLVRSCSW